MSNHRNRILRFVNYGNLIWISIGLAALAWVLDSLLDSLIFHQGTPIEQIINPTNREIGVRLLFGLVFVAFGIYIQFGIIKLKQAQDDLKVAIIKAEDETNKTKAIIEAIGDGIILQDTDYKIMYQNQIQNDIYGNRIGEYCYKAYEGRDTLCEDCPIELSFKDGKIHRTERRVATDSGVIYVELTGSSLRDSTGKIIGGVKVVRDITERRRTEVKLRESEERYRALFDAAPVGIGIIDLKGKVLDGNANMLEMTGFTLEELKSLDISDTYVDPDGRKLLLKTLQETGRVRDWEVRLKRKDGTIYYALLNADLLELGGHKIVLTTALDITGSKQAEKEKDRFLKAFAGSTDGITIADEKDRFIYVNDAYAMIFGYNQGELIGNTWHKITPPEMIASTEEGLSNTMRNKDIGVFYGEVPGLRKDGTIVPTEVRGNSLWDENGNYQGHICIVRDIAERKRMEESLKLFSEAVEAAPDGVQIADLEGHILYSNKAIEEIYGSPPAEFNGKHVDEMNVDPEFASSVILPSIRDKGRWVGELMVKHKDGHAFPIWLTASMITNSKGEPIALVGIISDITERKQMEEKLRKAHDELEIRVKERTAELTKANETLQEEITERKRMEEKTREQAALLDKAQDAIYVQDLEHHIIYCNKSAERLYGWSMEEIRGKNANKLLYKKVPPQLIDANKSIIERGEWIGELTQIKKNRKEIIIESRWTLMHDSEGKPKSILIINTDITEKKKLEVQLLRTQRLESIGTLASGIAHDINNVLSPIILSLELFKERFTDAESQKLINILEQSAKRGASLIKQVQSFARGVEGERIALQAGHLISEIRQIAKETFPRSIEITTDIPKDLWVISGDATQLHQVIMNLCVNARDAMPSGGILHISAENHFIDENSARINIEAKVGPYIVISVSDTGTGIPQEIRDRIFEPFFTTKGPGKGTGLGLSTALGIVKSHGGFINVYSEVGKGTAFKVYLPAITTTETQKAEERQLKLSTGHGELILVVDDEPQIQQITKKILEKYGYRVITSNNGEEAIALYNKNSQEIKIILMDMMMPVMGGLESIRELRKANPEIKIIAVSGLTEKDKLERIAETHVHAFLTKPYTTEKLLKTIHKVINTK